MDATTKFKLYLNSILNTTDEKVHNELWNHLFAVIMEKNQLQQEVEELKGKGAYESLLEDYIKLEEKYNDLLQRAREEYGKINKELSGVVVHYGIWKGQLDILERIFGKENLNPKEGE